MHKDEHELILAMSYLLDRVSFEPNIDVGFVASSKCLRDRAREIFLQMHSQTAKAFRPDLKVYNKTSIGFRNGSTIRFHPMNGNHMKGTSIKYLIVAKGHNDTRAFEELRNSILPVISSMRDGKFMVMEV